MAKAILMTSPPQALIPRSAYKFDKQVTTISIGEGSGPKPLRAFCVRRFEQLLRLINRVPQHRITLRDSRQLGRQYGRTQPKFNLQERLPNLNAPKLMISQANSTRGRIEFRYGVGAGSAETSDQPPA